MEVAKRITAMPYFSVSKVVELWRPWTAKMSVITYVMNSGLLTNKRCHIDMRGSFTYYITQTLYLDPS